MEPPETAPDLPSDVELINDPDNGTVRLMKGDNLGKFLKNDENYNKALSGESPEGIAIAFISAYRGLFKLRNPLEELSAGAVQRDDLGMVHIRLKQQYGGLPVWPADLNVHINASNRVYLIQGRYAPTPIGLTTAPDLSESEVLSVIASDLGITEGDFNKHRVELIVYCGVPTGTELAYSVYAETGPANAWEYIIDAETGAVIEKMPATRTHGVAGETSEGKIVFK